MSLVHDPPDALRIDGGRPLRGAVRVSGAKNAALPAMAASLLSGDDCILENVPAIADVEVMAELLRRLGAVVSQHDSTLTVRGDGVSETVVPTDLVSIIRGSFLVMGALLGRFGEVACASPGGDVIGQRPIDVHLTGFRALGAEVGRQDEKYYARVPPGGRLRGARIFLDYPSVLGTQNVLLAAVLAEGDSMIVNAAAEPEIVFLASMLNAMGARVEGAGTSMIRIEGVPELHGCRTRIIPDRIEAGTFAIAAAATVGDVRILDAEPRHLDALLFKLGEVGVRVEESESGFHVCGHSRYQPTSIQALPYPGLATDLQAPMAVLLTQASGVSLVHERVYDNRMMYLGELRKFGAEVASAGSTAIISGGHPLHPASARALDIRAGAALMIAGLVAEGESTVTEIHHLERAYSDLDAKLTALGARVGRVSSRRWLGD
ncbi:MAG: UDP-N-acetylglucosamine 1-carboxyvinyltransferase [Dehalococcoidia bacterium]